MKTIHSIKKVNQLSENEFIATFGNVFEKTNWPDFKNDIYEEILLEFKNRERRFGAILK